MQVRSCHSPAQNLTMMSYVTQSRRKSLQRVYATPETCSPIISLALTPANFSFTHSTPAILVSFLFLKHTDMLAPSAWNAFPGQPHSPFPHLHMSTKLLTSQWALPCPLFKPDLSSFSILSTPEPLILL